MRSKLIAISFAVLALALSAQTVAAAQKPTSTSTWVETPYGYFSSCSGHYLAGNLNFHFLNVAGNDGTYHSNMNVAGGKLIDETGRVYVYQEVMHGNETYDATSGISNFQYTFRVIPLGGKGSSAETLVLKFQIIWDGENTDAIVTTTTTCR
jgi:hypothetical protein